MLTKIARNPDFQSGIKDMLGPTVGILAWSIVLNLAILKAGVATLNTFIMAFISYAGSGQLAALPLMHSNVPIWIIFVTTVVINSRFIVYSAAIAPIFRHHSFFKRSLLGYFNGDLSFALFSRKYPQIDGTQHHPQAYHYYLGVSFMNWAVWQVGLVLAVIFGLQIPTDWEIAFAGTLVLICLIMPSIKSSKEVWIALISIVTCALTMNLPYRLGILFTVIVAMTAGHFLDKVKAANV